MEAIVLSEGRNRTKARVRLVRREGEAVVEKDYSLRSYPVRDLLGAFLLDREERALARLAGIPGIPALRGRPNRNCLAMEHLPGRPLAGFRGAEHTELPLDFFARLRGLVERIHVAGVAQGDIGARDVLVAPDGSPGLVDFSLSVVRSGAFPHSLRFRAAVRHDLMRIAHLHRWFSPQDLTADEARMLARRGHMYAWVRRRRDRRRTRQRPGEGFLGTGTGATGAR